jgi:hypothetical protein
VYEKYRSRKWILSIFVLILAAVMALQGKLSGELAQIITVVIGSYNGAQGIIDWAKTRNGMD